jgi:hypothetical protein
MNALKGLATAILGFLLFLSLTVFGIAYLLHATLLNPDFITAQVDSIDVSAVVRDIFEEQVSGQLPEEAESLTEAVYNVIDEQEPWLKEQLNGAIYTGYDFLLGKTDQLEITVSLEGLKASLKDSLWEALQEELPEMLPDLVEQELGTYIDEHWDELAGQIPEEYLPSEAVGLSEEQLRPYLQDYLRENEGQIAAELSKPEVSGLIDSLLEPYFDQFYDEFIGEIPSEYTVNEDDIPSDVMEQLLMVKKYVGYFQTGYWLLIVFMVVLAALIFLVNRNVRTTSRALGIDLLIFGIFNLAGVLLARSFNLMGYIPDIPASLETWLTGLFNDVLGIMLTFSIIILVVAVALLVVSFVVKPKAAEG